MRKMIIGLMVFSSVCSAQDKAGSGDVNVTDDLHKMTSGKHPIDDLPKKKLSDRALESLMDEMFLLDPEEKRRIYDEKRRRSAEAVQNMNSDPKEKHEIIPVSTRPEADLPEVYITPYHVSMITVIDSTGEPWPIVDASERHNNFTVEKLDQHEFKNLLKGTATYGVGNTNLSLVLSGLPSVVSVKLVAKDDVYHPAPVLQIDKPGPNAKVLPAIGTPGLEDADVMRRLVLADLPDNFKRMKTNDPNVDAWVFEESLYVRSTYEPSNPHPRAYRYGPNGYGAFKMAYVPVIVMVSESGVEKRIRITEGDY